MRTSSTSTQLRNPLSLAGLGGLAVVRGVAFLCLGTGLAPLNGYSNAPSLPGVGVTLVGIVWATIGVLVWVSMVRRRLIILSMSLMVGMYGTWVVVHMVDLFTSPDWDSIIGLAVYALMVPVTITLASLEIAPVPGKVLCERGHRGE